MRGEVKGAYGTVFWQVTVCHGFEGQNEALAKGNKGGKVKGGGGNGVPMPMFLPGFLLKEAFHSFNHAVDLYGRGSWKRRLRREKLKEEVGGKEELKLHRRIPTESKVYRMVPKRPGKGEISRVQGREE